MTMYLNILQKIKMNLKSYMCLNFCFKKKFSGISTFVGYLMPKASLYKNSIGTI